MEKTSKEIAESIFGYAEYRVFLAEWIAAKKAERGSFSLRAFSMRAGFASHNFCSYVIAGKRNCSTESARHIAEAMGLKGRAAEFFENLVLYNQADSVADRDYYYDRLRKAGRHTSYRQLEKDQFPFYEKWYYPVIRELMVLSDWGGDCSRLAKMVYPPIPVSEAEAAVEFLLRTGMVIRDESGVCALSHVVVTSENVPVYIKRKSRRDVLLVGADTIETVDPRDKYMAYSTVAMSRGCYEDVRKILDSARESVLARIAVDGAPDEVYETVFQVFPVTCAQKQRLDRKGVKQ